MTVIEYFKNEAAAISNKYTNYGGYSCEVTHLLKDIRIRKETLCAFSISGRRIYDSNFSTRSHYLFIVNKIRGNIYEGYLISIINETPSRKNCLAWKRYIIETNALGELTNV